MTRKQKRLALVGGVFVAAAVGVALVLSALNKAVAYFYVPADIAALPSPPEGLIRLGGLVEAGSVVREEGGALIRFTVADEVSQVPVSYRGILPDLFREGQGVVAQGRLVNGELQAVEVLAKHDENYMPREVAEALKEQGRWKEGEPPPSKP
ncbi:MAG: cytochrome c maturation protein CcmE [Pseudomonadota bacterium]|nr:cytochrome c maturation protein CcmE [Pseudomonadota bacterium]